MCRMGVGYDNLDRVAAAARQIMILNVPDYGTTEVADHAMALALSLRRGLLLHHETQRADPPAVWGYIDDPLVRRSSVQTFGIVGMGRIATAVALRAKAFGFRVVFFDPYLPNGVELGLGIHRGADAGGIAATDRHLVGARAADPGNAWPAGSEGAVAAAERGSGGEHRSRPDHRHRRPGDAAEKRPPRRGWPGRGPGGAAGRAGPRTDAGVSRA